MALESWNFDSEKFLSCLGVPNSNVVHTAGSKELGVASWEAAIVDLFVVASVSQLWVDVVGVAPVDSCLISSSEEVGLISGQRN